MVNSPPPSNPIGIGNTSGTGIRSSRSSPPPSSLLPPIPLTSSSSGTSSCSIGSNINGNIRNIGNGNNNNCNNNGSTDSQQSQSQQQQQQTQSQQLLCVRWGNYDSNIVSMFTKLRSAEHFVDVTLWCEGRTIKCHKIVLSACSIYFEQLLIENPNNHPIIFLKDMKYWEIEALVEFMYKGETSIHQDKLQSLLNAAESLQIKGLGSPPPSQASNTQIPPTHSSSNDINNNNSLSSTSLNDQTFSAQIQQPQQSNISNPIHQREIGNTNTGRNGILTGTHQQTNYHYPSHAHQNSRSGRITSPSPNGEESGNDTIDMSLFSLRGNIGGNSPNRHSQSQTVGMDLSNYHNSQTNNNSAMSSSSQHQSSPSSITPSFILTNSSSAKRRKKETPRRIGLVPRIGIGGNSGSSGGSTSQGYSHQYNSTYLHSGGCPDDGDEDGAVSDHESETKPENFTSINGAGGGVGSDDDSMPEPRPLILVDKAENPDGECGDGDSDFGDRTCES